MRLFCEILNQVGVNSNVLHHLKAYNNPLTRCEFLRELTFTLTEPYLQIRLQKPTFH